MRSVKLGCAMPKYTIVRIVKLNSLPDDTQVNAASTNYN